ncbi:hypothetical protein AVEN_50210-1 [Araneus ventricosus]|uniref:Uncharacterized protein n=1 Tax=Araneus ventricosus TaxID=182803 RepID=A0A4Y2B8C4_ARAVE|nr:hypothetical protein AVEN_50210-1 [Araneus ventricosus]
MASFGAKRKKSPKSQNIASDAVFKAVPDNEPLLTLLHLTRTLCYAIPHLSGCGGLVFAVPLQIMSDDNRISRMNLDSSVKERIDILALSNRRDLQPIATGYFSELGSEGYE